MVQLPSQADLKLLKDFTEPFCLTIYVPHIEIDPNAATNPNKIELKNLLVQARTALLDDGVKPGVARKTLRPARALLDNHEFWPLRHESLALFMHPKIFRFYHLPEGVPHMLTIERGFNLGPLLAAVKDNRPYLLLALSYKNVQLFQGDRFSLKKLKLKNFPANLEDALGIDEYPKVSETHAVAPAGEGKGSEAFHGQYNVRETKKTMLLQFFQLVDRSLRQFLRQKDMPVILAGVEYLLPMYHQVNTSPYVLDDGIRGNVEHERADALRQQAWAFLQSKGAA